MVHWIIAHQLEELDFVLGRRLEKRGALEHVQSACSTAGVTAGEGNRRLVFIAQVEHAAPTGSCHDQRRTAVERFEDDERHESNLSLLERDRMLAPGALPKGRCGRTVKMRSFLRRTSHHREPGLGRNGGDQLVGAQGQ